MRGARERRRRAAGRAHTATAATCIIFAAARPSARTPDGATRARARSRLHKIWLPDRRAQPVPRLAARVDAARRLCGRTKACVNAHSELMRRALALPWQWHGTEDTCSAHTSRSHTHNTHTCSMRSTRARTHTRTHARAQHTAHTHNLTHLDDDRDGQVDVVRVDEPDGHAGVPAKRGVHGVVREDLRRRRVRACVCTRVCTCARCVRRVRRVYIMCRACRVCLWVRRIACVPCVCAACVCVHRPLNMGVHALVHTHTDTHTHTHTCTRVPAGSDCRSRRCPSTPWPGCPVAQRVRAYVRACTCL